ncbi:Hypp5518 [Branchiostoma lanceolatum]|uniref:Hypp5518 protein n=1 Tax=Branchiostoma lanceolatum TaxID=7740 RepID=A0A8J9VI04_BRALA|nr:Hypp5518 [Branchiostoma lanceolatum]
MSNKVKKVLVLLLIILKETEPTTACDSNCPSDCDCSSRGLSSNCSARKLHISGTSIFPNTRNKQHCPPWLIYSQYFLPF